MPVDSVKALCQAIQDHGILDPARLKELAALSKKFTDLRALARELVQRGWLTPFQVNQLLQGRSAEMVLGDNVLLEKIGAGGMGAVYKALHRRLDRIVAVKVIRKEQIGNASAVQRFQQEAKAAARLSHPNIVAIYDAGEVGGTHYLALEYMEGTDLAKLVKERGPMSFFSACECIRQAALGLQHAHEQGMVHRDIKPHNLLLNPPPSSPPSQGGAGGVVKILDMGLARLSAQAEGAGEGLTASGTIVGTIDYMSPEQAEDSFGEDPLPLAQYAWYKQNSGDKTHPVGQLKPNAWGLHDMEGNVWEWVGDWYGDYANKLMKDPQGARTGDRRVLRGGSWDADEGRCRAAPRDPPEPGSRNHHVGFRVVCVVAARTR